MIPNNHPPLYDNELRDVVAWNGNRAVVVNLKTGLLEPARPPLHHSDEVLQLIPGTGWEVIFNAGTATECREPLTAWGVTANGVIPLSTDSAGEVADARIEGALIVPTGTAIALDGDIS